MKTALTIGFFDGVHIGHRALLHTLRKFPHTTILTFSNHPLSFFAPPGPPLLIPLEKRKELLKPFADELIILPFDQSLANTPFDQLLDRFDLEAIILGKGAVFGKDRQGTEENVRLYAENKGIVVEYLPKILFQGKIVSSSNIRKALQKNQTQLAHQLLGHPS